MRKRFWLGLGVVVGIPAAAAAVLGAAPAATATDDLVQVVTGLTGVNLSTIAQSPTVPASTGDGAQADARGVTVPDLIYFGTCWWQFQTTTNTMPPLLLGGGYRNAQVIYDDQGNYFAGTVEKVDAQGRVTDVILAFAAAKTGSGLNALQDVTDGEALSYNLPASEADKAAGIFGSLMDNPAYAQARIHVSGLSLGAALTQYVLGYSLATYGRERTAARGDFVQFGTPGYSQGIATHFGLRVGDFDGLITAFNVKNDPTPSDLPPTGIPHGVASLNAQLMGTVHWLADYQPYGTSPTVAALNGVSAHESLPYIAAFGLPDWLTAGQQQTVTQEIVAAEPSTDRYDPRYGVGGVSQTIIGDGAANRLRGTASDDALQGGGGADILTGGGGRDTFIYANATDSTSASPDVITDWHDGDVIDLTGLRAASGFTFVGSGVPAMAGQVGYRIVGSQTRVEINTTGGAAPDMVILLAGQHNLSAVDFALGGTLSNVAHYLLYQAYNTTGDPFIDHVYLGFSL